MNQYMINVDINLPNRKLFEILTKKYNYDCRTFANGSDTLEFYDTNKFNIGAIFTNIPLTDMSGFELLDEIRIRGTTPVIALTSHILGMTRDFRRDYLDRGFTDALLFPVDVKDLVTTIRNLKKYSHDHARI